MAIRKNYKWNALFFASAIIRCVFVLLLFEQQTTIHGALLTGARSMIEEVKVTTKKQKKNAIRDVFFGPQQDYNKCQKDTDSPDYHDRCRKGGTRVRAEFAESDCCSKKVIVRYPNETYANCDYLGLLHEHQVSPNVTGAVFTSDLPTPSAYQNPLNAKEGKEHSFIITGTNNDPTGHNIKVWSDTTYKKDMRDTGGETYLIRSISINGELDPDSRKVHALVSAQDHDKPALNCAQYNAGLMIGVIPVGDVVHNNNEIFLMNFCNPDKFHHREYGGSCSQLCDDVAKCKFYIYPGTKFISPYTNQPVNAISISKGYEEFEHPMFVATLTYAYPDRFITPLIYEMIGTYKRNKLVLPYDMHKIFGIEFVDRFIVATEAGKITNDGKAVTQSGSINIFTMQAYADPIKRILSQPIAPWSPVSVAPGKEYIVTGGICQSECEYSLMGVVDVWETKFNGTFSEPLHLNTTFKFDSWVTTVEFSPDGNYIMVGCQNGDLSLLSRKNQDGGDIPWARIKNIKKAVKVTSPPLSAHANPYPYINQFMPQVMQINWAPDGNRFVVSSPTGSVFKVYSL